MVNRCSPHFPGEEKPLYSPEIAQLANHYNRYDYNYYKHIHKELTEKITLATTTEMTAFQPPFPPMTTADRRMNRRKYQDLKSFDHCRISLILI
ncbi:hypothetical protein YC2023_009030 [Brassica napus]